MGGDSNSGDDSPQNATPQPIVIPKLNVPTPVNSTLVALVKGLEYARSDYPGKA